MRGEEEGIYGEIFFDTAKSLVATLVEVEYRAEELKAHT